VVINSNIFYMFDKSSLSHSTGVKKAAAIACAALSFKEGLHSGTVEPAMEKDRPLCMHQFNKLFSATRIPLPGKDIFRYPGSFYDPSPLKAENIVVIRRGHIFTVRVLHDGKYENSMDQIEKALEKVVSMSEERLPDERSVGILTTLERDSWASFRNKLCSYSGRNEKNLREIEDALFVVCLDDTTPEDRNAAASAMLAGNGRDRWFDKVLQFVVCEEGTSAINMEHSSVDGSSIVTLTDFISGFSDVPEENILSGKRDLEINELVFDLDEGLRDGLRQSCRFFDSYETETSLKVLDFCAFGKERIKTFGISPDGFVQMGFQLAIFKLLGKPCNTYEPVSMRHFLHGRTEAMRSVTPESVDFCRLMVSDGTSDQEKIQSLKKAAAVHVERVKECRKGNGVDRHLLGLKKIYELFGENLGIHKEPEIFRSAGYRTLCYNKLSTSTSGYSGLSLCGFGPVVEDGFGIRYLTRSDQLNLCVSCRSLRSKEHELFYRYIEESFLEMADLMGKGI
jgi:carnitine O-acetyltransferase